MRTSELKKKISELFNKKLSFSLNAEECISKGAVLYGALNSHSVKIKEYKIENILSDKISISIPGLKNEININENDIITPTLKSIKLNINKNTKKLLNLNIYSNSNLYKKYEITLPDNLETNKIELRIRIDVNKTIILETFYLLNNTKDKQNIPVKQIDPKHLSDDQIIKIQEKELEEYNNELLIEKTNDTRNNIEELFYNYSELIEDKNFLKYLNQEEDNNLKEKIKFSEEIIDDEVDVKQYDYYKNMEESLLFYKNEVKYRKYHYDNIPNLRKYINSKMNEIDLMIKKKELKQNKEQEENKTKIEENKDKELIEEEKEEEKKKQENFNKLLKEARKWYSEMLEKTNTYNINETPSFSVDIIKNEFNNYYKKINVYLS